MTLQSMIAAEEHAKLPDHLKPEYKLNDKVGKYVLDVAPQDGWALEDLRGLKAALSDKTEKLKSFQTRVTEYDERYKDLDPDAARQAIERLATLGDLGDKGKVEQRIEGIKTQYEQKLKSETEKATREAALLTAQINKLLVDGEVARLLNEDDTKGSYPLLIGAIRERVRVERDDKGSFVPRVYDPATGNPVISQKASDNSPMGLKELLSVLKSTKDYAPAFAGSGNTGGGAVGTGNAGNGRTTTPAVDPKLPAVERLKLLRRAEAARGA